MNPHELGAPEKFKTWRPGQDRAFQHLLDSTKRFDVLSLPTGTGKSLLGVLYAKLLGQRAVILTATKGLQDQYASEFGDDIVDLRGMSNHPCKLAIEMGVGKRRRDPMCDEGPCLDGVECEYVEHGCHYFDQLRRAKHAPIVVTNYAMWFSLLTSTHNLGERDVLICDEAHDAPSILAGAVGCEFKHDEISVPRLDTPREWKEWAEGKLGEIKEALGYATGQEKRRLRDLGRRLNRLCFIDEKWVWHHSTGRGASSSFEPTWASDWAEPWLFQQIPRVVFLSATVTPQTLGYLGLKKDDYYYLDMPSPFAVSRRPVIHVPTIRVSFKTTESELRVWVGRHDQVIGARQDRKGICHPVSYKRAKFLRDHSEFKDIMLLPRNSRETREMVEKFRKMPPPAVLVSPSVHTGYDFPGDAARYQIIGKLPFPDTTDKIIKARSEEDKDYLMWVMATTLQQTCGRINRSEEDWSETFILDDLVAAPWILKKNGHLFTKAWTESFKSLAVLPKPPPIGEVR